MIGDGPISDRVAVSARRPVPSVRANGSDAATSGLCGTLDSEFRRRHFRRIVRTSTVNENKDNSRNRLVVKDGKAKRPICLALCSIVLWAINLSSSLKGRDVFNFGTMSALFTFSKNCSPLSKEPSCSNTSIEVWTISLKVPEI